MDDFRLGVQKCRKTIDDGVGNPEIFAVEGLDLLFKMLRVAQGNTVTITILYDLLALIYSISPTFCEQLLRRYLAPKNYKPQSVIREKLQKHFGIKCFCSPMVNFINILCPNFLYECFAQLFSSYVLAL